MTMTYYESLAKKMGIELSVEVIHARNNLKLSKEFYSEGDKNKPAIKRSVFNEQGLRICCMCHEAKFPDEYTTNRNTIDGRDARCKECKRKYMTGRYA